MTMSQRHPDCFIVVCSNDPKVVGVTDTMQDAREWVAALASVEPRVHYRALRATYELAEYRHDWGWTSLWVREGGKEVELAVVGQPLRPNDPMDVVEYVAEPSRCVPLKRRHCRPG